MTRVLHDCRYELTVQRGGKTAMTIDGHHHPSHGVLPFKKAVSL